MFIFNIFSYTFYMLDRQISGLCWDDCGMVFGTRGGYVWSK